MILTDTPVKNALEAEAAKRKTKVKGPTSRKVARTLAPKKQVKAAKRPKATEEDACQCLVCDEPFGNSRPGGREVGELHRLWQVGPRGLHKRGSMLCLPQL